jgi:hypothetical protein
MKGIFLSFVIAVVFSTKSFANCLPVVEAKIEAKQERLLFAKKKQKKAVIVTGATVGGVNAVFWGTMFKLIADGATIPISMLVGAGYGVVTGGAAVAVVGVPMIAYNQIIKAQIRRMKKTQTLLSAAYDRDVESRLLKKMYSKVKRKLPDLTMDELIDKINYASEQMTFCPNEGRKIYSFNKIKRYLRKNDNVPLSSPDENNESIVVESVLGHDLDLEVDYLH